MRHLSQQAASLRRAQGPNAKLEGKAVELDYSGERAPPTGSSGDGAADGTERVRVLAETRDEGTLRRQNLARRPVQSAPAQRSSAASAAGGGGGGGGGVGGGNPRPPPTFAVPRLSLPMFHAGASGTTGCGGGGSSGEHIGCLNSDEVAAFAALAGLPAAVVEVFEADAVDGEVVAAMMNGAGNADELRECVRASSSRVVLFVSAPTSCLTLRSLRA